VNDRRARPSSKVQIAHRTVAMWQSDMSVADTAIKKSEAGAMADSEGEAGIMVGPIVTRCPTTRSSKQRSVETPSTSSAGTTKCTKHCE